MIGKQEVDGLNSTFESPTTRLKGPVSFTLIRSTDQNEFIVIMRKVENENENELGIQSATCCTCVFLF